MSCQLPVKTSMEESFGIEKSDTFDSKRCTENALATLSVHHISEFIKCFNIFEELLKQSFKMQHFLFWLFDISAYLYP